MPIPQIARNSLRDLYDRIEALEALFVAGNVNSVFGRTGVVTAQTNDYTWSQLDKSISSLADIATRSAADLTSGTIDPARLGSGSGGSTKFLREDSTWQTVSSGDASTNTSSSVDSEIALFSGTGGKTLKRASTTGLLKGTSGVISAASAGTDYYNPGGTDVAVADGGTGASTLTGIIKGNGTSAFTAASAGTDYIFPGGVSGGQTLNGDTDSGGNLTLHSTAHATKGKILLGASAAFDQANTRLGIGTASPSAKLSIGGNVTDVQFLTMPNSLTLTGALNVVDLSATVTLGASGGVSYLRQVPQFIPTANFASNLISTNNNLSVGNASANAFNLSGSLISNNVQLITASGYTGTITRFMAYRVANPSIGGAATVTTQSGLHMEDLTTATNNSLISIGQANPPTGNWGIFNAATKDNALRGNVRIGSTTAPTVALDVTGDAKISGTTTLATSLSGPLKASSGVVSSSAVDLSGSEVTSTLTVGKGGTGQTSYTNGQLLIGNTTGNTLAKGTLSAGTGIGIDNGAGSITVRNKPTTIQSAFSTQAGNFTTTSTSYVDVTGMSFTYTPGATNERLFLWLHANFGNSGNNNTFLTLNIAGSDLPFAMFTNAIYIVGQSKLFVYDIAGGAGATTIKVRAKVASGTATVITNVGEIIPQVYGVGVSNT